MFSDGAGILGVGGGLRGRSTVCTELEVIMHTPELAWGGGLEFQGTETRFRLWFASISAAVDGKSFDLTCAGGSTVWDAASTKVGFIGDAGGDGCTPVST